MISKNILLMYSNHTLSSEHISQLKKIAPDFDIVVADSENSAIEAARDSEIILGHRYLRQCLPYAPMLRWVQTTGGGIDHLPLRELKEKGILLTRTTFPSEVIARHAYTIAWALIRRLPDCFSLQRQKTWFPKIELLPMPKIALILGFGCIGQELAKLLKRDGIQVWAVKRKVDESSKKLCDRLFDGRSWRQALSQVDLCFLSLPLNRFTRGLFDESALCSLPKHAIIVNVGRGATLDIKTVIRLLKEGRLGGAGLDVLDPQPPAQNDPVWETPHLIITPYIAARYPERAQQIEKYIENQLYYYLTNGHLENIIDWSEVEKDYEC